MGAKSQIVPFAQASKRRSGNAWGATAVEVADFRDRESQRVLAAAARSVARELGRQAARDCFAAAFEKRKER